MIGRTVVFASRFLLHITFFFFY